MDIELPNGTIIQGIPEGTPKSVVMEKAIKAGLAKAEDFSVQPQQQQTNAPSSGILMGIKEPISGAAQMLPKGLEFLTSAGGLAPNPVSQYFGSEAERVRAMNAQEEAAYQQQRAAQGDTGFDVGRLVGNVISPANLVAGARAAQGARALGAGLGTQAAAAGAVQGAMQPVNEPTDFAQEKATQIGLGAVAGKVGEAVASATGKVLNPLASKAEQTMRDLGVTPTPGQTLGGVYKKAEDFAQNLPLIGGQIRNAREKVLFDFNKGVINKTLDKVGDKLPEDVVGRDAVAYAAEQVSNKYDEVLSKMKFDLDFKTTSGILDALNKASLPSSAQREEAVNVLNNIALDKFSGKTLTGAEYKAIESDLLKEVIKYRNSATAADRNIGDALEGVLKTFKTELYQQNQKYTPQLRRVDSAYGDLKIMERAAANTGAENGVFTPKQYSMAVKQSDITRQKSAFARGAARGQELSEAALKTIGQDATSTLEGRLAIGSLGGIAALSKPIVSIPAIAGTSALYSPMGIRAADVALRQRPELARLLGQSISGSSGLLGGGIAPQGMFGARRD
jgi:hypothetical protein